MKSRSKPEGDTTKEFLVRLAADKDTILTEAEYDDVRSSTLERLAKPPRVDWVVAGPGIL